MRIDLTDPRQLRDLLKKYKLWAKKRFGQNFLVDRNILQTIVECADLQEEDTIVEIGPGPGVLTTELLHRTKKVFAVEIDRDIIPVLRETTHFNRDKLTIFNQHVLDFVVPDEPYKLVANIPYHLTSPILRKFLPEAAHRPQSITLLVQKEVAEKICHPQRRSVLSLIVETFGDASIAAIVPASCFFPSPKVDSAILHIAVAKEPRIHVAPRLFFHAVKMGFAQPRKKLKNNLPAALLAASQIDGDLRAETLSIPDWERIATELEKLTLKNSPKNSV